MRVEIHLHQHVQEALLRRLRDRGVGPDDGVAGDGVPESDHQVLADGETEGLGGVLELEGEDPRVPRDDAFAVEDGFGPGTGLEEGGSRGGGLFALHFAFAEDGFGGFVEGADVVVWHHCFGRFRVYTSMRYSIDRPGDMEKTHESP